MIDNNDPIQEKKVFRVGLDDLTENNDVNTFEYNDLHNCSNDLSDRGSRLEEIAHARYAESKRRNSYSSYNSNKTTTTASKWITFIILFLFIGIPIIEAIIGVIIAVITETVDNLDNYSDNSTDYSYSDIYESEMYPGGVSCGSKITLVDSTMDYTNNVLSVEVENIDDYENLDNYKIEVVFYNINDRPIEVIDLQINKLKASEVVTKEVYNVPTDMARYDFIITENTKENQTWVYTK